MDLVPALFPAALSFLLPASLLLLLPPFPPSPPQSALRCGALHPRLLPFLAWKERASALSIDQRSPRDRAAPVVLLRFCCCV